MKKSAATQHCTWCDENVIPVPMQSGAKMPMLCIYCGSGLGWYDHKQMTELIRELVHENAALRKRLEIPEVEGAESYDGIYCRDETIRQLEGEVRRLREERASGWVSVGERLPDFRENVLVFRKGEANKDCVSMAYRTEKWGNPEKWDWCETPGYPNSYWGISVDGEITHWQPMPAPPKEG